MISLQATRLDSVAVLAMHCDDIAIGAGGTLLTLARANPGLAIQALVLTGGRTEREAEERSALRAFCPNADVSCRIVDVPDGRGPAHWSRVKDELARFRDSCEPQLIFGPQRGDAHQDHRILAELIPTEFRDHLVLGYEILKWETDTPAPTVYSPLTRAVAEEKVRLLHKSYPSQVAHDWFDEASFLGLARLRGVQCRSPYAEGFVLEKAKIAFGGVIA